MSGNDEQIEYWNGEGGARWLESHEQLDRMLQPLSEVALGKANAQPGERVIDVGCGCGTTSIAMADAGAAVWGVDISGPMVKLAKERTSGRDDIAFSETDASTQSLTPDHDLVFSRFGVMFFADPVAAFSNLKTGLTPGGRLVFLCWQPPRENAWMATAGRAVQPFLPEPEVPPDPRAPGPFAFADPSYVEEILGAAGFTNIVVDPVTATLHLADGLDEAVHFQGKVGPLARALAELDGNTREQALLAAREALAEHVTDEGINLGAATWLVSASA